MRALLLVVMAVFSACGSTQVVRVPVEAKLAEREEAPAVMVRNQRIAVITPVVGNDPDRRVDFTNAFAESYPTMSHLVVAVPQALREVGFEVIEARTVEDAQAARVDYILELGDPEVTSVHPADGDRVTLVGSAYDVRVRYKGRIVDGKSTPMGVVMGYGQDTARFLYMEPLFKQAMVGVAISVATLAASLFVLVVVFQFGLLVSLATGTGEPFGLCTEGTGPLWQRMPNMPFRSRAEVCSQLVNTALSFAFVTTVSLITSVAGSVGGQLGENVVDVALAFAHMTRVDPTWRGMVKVAHDEAARDLASQVANRALHPYHAPPAPPPSSPAEPAPARSTPPPANGTTPASPQPSVKPVLPSG